MPTKIPHRTLLRNGSKIEACPTQRDNTTSLGGFDLKDMTINFQKPDCSRAKRPLGDGKLALA
eukprot:2278290-Pyramimonas_sp.AAC.1